MRRVLYVAEKNDVAKGVANILSRGAMQRREGRSKFNKIYQLQGQFQGQPALISVTSVSGHLMNNEFGPEMRGWESIAIERCFDAPVHSAVNENMQNIATTLREESNKADTVVIWTDCDREGENIGAEIVKVCKEGNWQIDVWRAKFSEVTSAAVHRAVQNLGRLDQRIVDAVDCRSELDLRIGAAFTRLQTIHLRKRTRIFAAGEKGVISYGSCQFPTLGFVVERYKEIESFISEKFWRLIVELTRDGTKVEFLWDRVRLFNREMVDVLYDECRDEGSGKVEEVTKKPKTRWRPTALDTVELEKLGVRKLRMSAKEVMTIAEKLYSNGWISYPRTETNKFPPDFGLAALVDLHKDDQEWGGFATKIIQRGPSPRDGSKSDEAHPPIHPLKYANKTQLTAQEWRVYELVVRHFLACCSWNAVGQETKVTLRIGEEGFVATGLQVEDMGFMEVYPYEKWADKQLPAFGQGEVISDHMLRIADGETTAPPLLNEADLIALMDKFGIGTDATHADHIEKIKERQYVGVQPDGRFLPGFLGLALIDAYDEMGYAMSKPQLRADLERQLNAICEGIRTKEEVLEEQLSKYRAIFVQTENNQHLLSKWLTRYGRRSNLDSNSGAPLGGGGRGGGTGRGRGRGGVVAQIPDHATPTVTASTRGRGRGRGRAAAAAAGGGVGAGRGRGGGGVAAGAAGGGGGGGAYGRPPAVTNDDKQCLCGQASTIRTVQKEGPNKGRQFWTCSKPMAAPDKCNFFEWAA
ncbi:hypothetical protein PFISCL1PPCAC_8913 [Pristionchus fissidentatus]|uniref:DNA topoisomerase n=1 Tax=Pristionchus fissidentatus TaxID=1538716 RepID=A0AAV5VG27_9BILA|nr:hypothetical protein PFISCL1PPCAC_8913 [Pristionchus fissidentatus]